MIQVTHSYAKDVLVVVKLLRSPARGFRSLAGQFLVFQLLVVAIVLIAIYVGITGRKNTTVR